MAPCDRVQVAEKERVLVKAEPIRSGDSIIVEMPVPCLDHQGHEGREADLSLGKKLSVLWMAVPTLEDPRGS